METANIMLALGGDPGNTIPKFGVTPSEIAVLQAIHGNEAVTDILPTGTIERRPREELGELHRKYGKARAEGSQSSFVELLFPGAAARVFTTLDELDLDESFYKAESRAKSGSKATKTEDEQAKPLTKADAAEKKKAVAKAKADAKALKDNAETTQKEPADDGVDDINDEHAGEDASNTGEEPLFNV